MDEWKGERLTNAMLSDGDWGRNGDGGEAGRGRKRDGAICGSGQLQAALWQNS